MPCHLAAPNDLTEAQGIREARTHPGTPQLPVKIPQIPSNRDQKTLIEVHWGCSGQDSPPMPERRSLKLNPKCCCRQSKPSPEPSKPPANTLYPHTSWINPPQKEPRNKDRAEPYYTYTGPSWQLLVLDRRSAEVTGLGGVGSPVRLTQGLCGLLNSTKIYSGLVGSRPD